MPSWPDTPPSLGLEETGSVSLVASGDLQVGARHPRFEDHAPLREVKGSVLPAEARTTTPLVQIKRRNAEPVGRAR